MDLGLRSPILDFFKRGEVARDAPLVEPANVSEEILRTIGTNRGWISQETK